MREENQSRDDKQIHDPAKIVPHQEICRGTKQSWVLDLFKKLYLMTGSHPWLG